MDCLAALILEMNYIPNQQFVFRQSTIRNWMDSPTLSAKKFHSNCAGRPCKNSAAAVFLFLLIPCRSCAQSFKPASTLQLTRACIKAIACGTCLLQGGGPEEDVREDRHPLRLWPKSSSGPSSLEIPIWSRTSVKSQLSTLQTQRSVARLARHGFSASGHLRWLKNHSSLWSTSISTYLPLQDVAFSIFCRIHD